MTIWTPSLQVKARAERERRRRTEQRAAALAALPTAAFLAQTKIEAVTGDDVTIAPFAVWPEQARVLDTIARERLILFLKARQLGISWLTCGYVLHQCVAHPGQTWLLFSQGQLEANELTRRISVMHEASAMELPHLTTDNKQELVWRNGSRVLSLPATRRAGRTFTATGVVLDEWAFMTWGRETLAAVKPVIDAGGKLVLISTADGNGTPYHQAWQAAQNGKSGYAPIFLPWHARPDRGPGWRDAKLREAAINGDSSSVYREYPENPDEAFTHAAGRVYAECWRDTDGDGNVTDAADYQDGAGVVGWAVDDGYAGMFDRATGMYTAESHPRVILWWQEKPDGHLDIFDESYAVQTLSDAQIDAALSRAWPMPSMAVVDKSAAELKARLHARGIMTQNGPASVEESIKETRRALAADGNNWRRVRVHPRCTLLRKEMSAYRLARSGAPVKAYDHGPDALRYLVWSKRFGGGHARND